MNQLFKTRLWMAFFWIPGIVIQGIRINAQDELKEFVLHPECQIELVAQEPQVVDPIAARFDERGRLWVVEMRDYPTLQGDQPTSKIKILEDRNLDGFFETATVFADNLMFPTGLQPWKRGVIATVEGQVVYMADNDGDNRCDEKRILFRGFAAKNTQLRANHPTFGPDGLIYVANGLRNGEVFSQAESDKRLSIVGKDFCFDPTTLDYSAVTGYGQFGLTFDSDGNRYTCTNRNPLKRIVFEDEYLQQAKGISISKTVADVAAAGPDSRLFPISKTWTTSNLHANQFTAACGVHICDGIALPGSFVGNAFTCDPTANLVHREVISFKADSVVGSATPARTHLEFLASPHPAFRPVNLNGGPDDALYVVDMRRTVIEHPQFMPPELKNRPDLRSGSSLGRIYRIRKNKTVAKYGPIRVDPVGDLFGYNSWKRETAHRLLAQDFKDEFVEPIRKGLTRPSSHPNGIIRALSLLQAHKQLRPIDYEFAVSHYATGVRVFGMRLCEQGKQELIKNGVMDESDRVRFQALLSLTKCGIELTVPELKTVALNSSQNEWVRTALVMAGRSQANRLFNSILQGMIRRRQKYRNHDAVVRFCQQLAPIAFSDRRQDARGILDACLKAIPVTDLSLSDIAIEILTQPGTQALRSQVVTESSTAMQDLRRYLSGKVKRGVYTDAELLLLALVSRHSSELEWVALREQDPTRQLAAIKAMKWCGRPEFWIELTDEFRKHPFDIRNEILKQAYVQKDVARPLLDKVKAGDLGAVELGVEGRKRLLAHRDRAIREYAATVLKISVPQDREIAFAKYKESIQMKASAVRGKPVFEKVCAACHRLGKLGNQIGPDISDTRTKTKSQLLLDIIRPNAAIDNNYVEYLIEQSNGKVVKGIILENNATAITLKQADNQLIVVARDDIERIQSSGKSLMPVGLEQDLTVQQVADLLSFLQNWRYLDQNIPFSENENAK